MLMKIIPVMALAILSSLSFAATDSKQTCEGAACFNQFSMAAQDSALLKNAKKVAWRPGHYERSSSSDASSSSSWGSGWFVSVPKTGPANSKGTIVFNPRHSTFAAYDSRGDLVKSGRASGGMSWCDDVQRSCRTPVGTFRVYHKGPADCISSKYPLDEGGGAPMPHCMYFNGGYAIHGSGYVPNRPASHGCIRVTPSNAKWLHNNFVKVGTVVKVQSY